MGSASPIDAEVLARATAEVQRASRVLVMSHWRPDGDAIGCVVALREVLRALGKQVLAGLPDEIPGRYAFMAESEPLANFAAGREQMDAFAPDLVIVADTSARGQLEPVVPFLEASTARRLVVDHHVTYDIDKSLEIRDTSAGATGLVLADWFAAAGWSVNRTAADALFVAMATDTGWFRFSSADGRMYRAAAGLIDAHGVQPDRLYQQLYLSESPARLRLLAELLGSLELHAGGRLAACHVTREMFERTGAHYWETEDLINEPQRIGCVRVTVLLIEEPDGKVRMSLRSKDDVNVATIAEQFGGGGHQRAAGARAAGPLVETKKKVVAAIEAAVNLP